MAEPEQRQSGGVSEAGRGGRRVREGHGRCRDRRGDWGRDLALQIGRMRCGLTLGELGGLSGHGGSGGGEGVRTYGREAEDGQAAAAGTRPRMPGY